MCPNLKWHRTCSKINTISSGFASIPSFGSGAATTTSNAQGKQTQDPKYPLWKYVTKEAGPGNKAKGGGMLHGNAVFVTTIS